MKELLTDTQNELIKDFENYYGDIPKIDMPFYQHEIECKVKSLRQGLYMLYSANEITEHEYSEALGILTNILKPIEYQ